MGREVQPHAHLPSDKWMIQSTPGPPGPQDPCPRAPRPGPCAHRTLSPWPAVRADPGSWPMTAARTHGVYYIHHVCCVLHTARCVLHTAPTRANHGVTRHGSTIGRARDRGGTGEGTQRCWQTPYHPLSPARPQPPILIHLFGVGNNVANRRSTSVVASATSMISTDNRTLSSMRRLGLSSRNMVCKGRTSIEDTRSRRSRRPHTHTHTHTHNVSRMGP